MRKLAFLSAALTAFVLPSLASDDGGPPDALPFERTEVRVSCDNYDPLKQPFFGELHLHTAYSFDSGAIDTRNTPENAYNYARGERVGLAPWP